MTRRIAFVVFPGFQLLDAAGPIAAFEIAGRYRADTYELAVLAPEAGPVASSSGVKMAAEALDDGPIDTIVVAGGDGTRSLPQLAKIVAWLRVAAPRARRVTSVCSGAYMLAEAGLLDGKRATTHWQRSDDFARRYPKVRLEPDRIFVREDQTWTSAGITAGIDLALALIEDDHGSKVARATAQQLVVHQRRPGGQSQFSALLDTGGVNGRFAALMDWVRERLAEPLNVERLAAEAAGFHDPERMRRAFLRAFGQPPQALRRAARA
jgi:transcriptional regulator GlxA family with amidase domain